MIYLKINENTEKAKAFVQLAKTMEFVEVIEDDIPNRETIKAIEDAGTGKVNTYKTGKDLFKKLDKKVNE
jgi:hypothetical protein